MDRVCFDCCLSGVRMLAEKGRVSPNSGRAHRGGSIVPLSAAASAAATEYLERCGYVLIKDRAGETGCWVKGIVTRN